MFNLGDKIVYPMHGVGTIDAIEKKVVLGKRNEFYIITILNNGMNVMIPVDQADNVGLRSIISKREVKKVMNLVKKEDVADEVQWS